MYEHLISASVFGVSSLTCVSHYTEDLRCCRTHCRHIIPLLNSKLYTHAASDVRLV